MKVVKTKEYFLKAHGQQKIRQQEKRKLNRQVRKKSLGSLPEGRIKMENRRVNMRKSRKPNIEIQLTPE